MANGVNTSSTNTLQLQHLIDPLIKSIATGPAALLDSGAVVTDLNVQKPPYGKVITCPVIDPFAKAQTPAENAPLVARIIEDDSFQITLKEYGDAYTYTDFAKATDTFGKQALFLSGIANSLKAKQEEELIAAAVVETNYSDYILDRSTETFDQAMISDARTLWGAEDDEVVMIAMHPSTLGTIRKAKTAIGSLIDPAASMKNPTINGVPVFLSTQLPKVGNVFTSLMFQRGAMVRLVSSETMDIFEVPKDLYRQRSVAWNCLGGTARRPVRPGRRTPGVVIMKHL